ncbi:MAG: prepilin-type N-terminal cleavage/methylation domain-containing protein [Candidatus Thiodiazotropha sp. (ex Semelilucina semeliformis)]|nr:prepilin-type N-terminal cleavage/methylation domain-containing protein [Candidatus Thiodiazotropha sp. (ex Semelilucina semeliformis)]
MAGIERCKGLTLIELLVVMAILAIIGTIAIPFYTDYVDEARIHTTRQNAEPLRLALEDYFLDETTYIAGTWIPSGANTLETGDLGWRPDSDGNQYRYSVVAGATGIATSYTLTVTSVDGRATIQCDRDQTAGTFVCDSL